MRPIRLTLSGINSFLNEQTIPFDELMSRGLFGIFGPTGSGKSTLIDAMLLALYGQNSLPRNTKDFIHTDADTGYVKLVFIGGTGELRKEYTVERQFKRSTTGVVTKLCRLTTNEPEGIVLDKAKDIDTLINEVLGLDEDQFLRTVVLPQGKFSEFIQLEPKDRRKMLEEIFRLEAFGDVLYNKIREYKNNCEMAYKNIEGQLSQLAEVSEDRIRELASLIEMDQGALMEQLAVEKQLSGESEVAKQRHEWTRRRRQLEHHLKELQLQQEAIENQRQALKQHRVAQQLETPYLELQKTSEALTSLRARKHQLDQAYQESQTQFSEISHSFEHLKQQRIKDLPLQQEQLGQLKTAVLQQAALIKWADGLERDQKQLKTLQEALAAVLPELNAKMGAIDEYLKVMQTCDEALALMGNVDDLYDVVTKAAQLEMMLSADQAALLKHQEAQGIVENTGKAIRTQVKAFEEGIKSVEDSLTGLSEAIQTQLKEKEAHLGKRSDIDLKCHFAELKHALKSGEPCPLCLQQVAESFEASPVMLAAKQEAEQLLADWEAALSDYDAKLNALMAERESQERSKQDLMSLKAHQDKLLAEAQAEWKAGNVRIQQLAASTQIQQDELTVLRDQHGFASAAERLEGLKQEQQKRRELQKQKETAFKAYQGDQSVIQSLQSKKNELEIQRGQLEERLKQTTSAINEIETLYGLTLQSPDQSVVLETLEKHMQANERAYQASEVAWQQLNEQLSSQKEEMAITEGRLTVLSQQFEKGQQQLEALAAELGDAELVEQAKIGAHRLALLPEDQANQSMKAVELYDKRLVELQHEKALTDEQLKMHEVDDAALEAVESALEAVRQAVKGIELQLANHRQEHSRLSGLAVTKAKLVDTAESLGKTLGLAAQLFKLMKGGKFVEFVAMAELKYILREASIRLLDMSGNRYSLEVDSKGNFMISDHFEGGVTRDLRSLSGGETFIASLSLALAMSSRIQMKGRTMLELFLLDEGFGTLDDRLLDVVMTALERLHGERVTVGLISHVEELKNRVPIKLEVTPAVAGIRGSTIKLVHN